MTIRYLLDEHVPHAVAHGLRLRGVEAITLAEANLLSARDDEILAHALRERLVVFSQDDDFVKIASRGASHAGVVYSKQGKRALGEIVQLLKLLSECLACGASQEVAKPRIASSAAVTSSAVTSRWTVSEVDQRSPGARRTTRPCSASTDRGLGKLTPGSSPVT